MRIRLLNGKDRRSTTGVLKCKQDRGGRGGFRGGQANRGGPSSRGGRGGAASGGKQGDARPKKEAILDLSKYVDKEIKVKFQGGREVIGVLKGHDQLQNLVLDDVREEYTDGRPPRQLGLVVLRGPTLVLITPTEGYEEIENPFAQEE